MSIKFNAFLSGALEAITFPFNRAIIYDDRLFTYVHVIGYVVFIIETLR